MKDVLMVLDAIITLLFFTNDILDVLLFLLFYGIKVVMKLVLYYA